MAKSPSMGPAAGQEFSPAVKGVGCLARVSLARRCSGLLTAPVAPEAGTVGCLDDFQSGADADDAAQCDGGAAGVDHAMAWVLRLVLRPSGRGWRREGGSGSLDQYAPAELVAR